MLNGGTWFHALDGASRAIIWTIVKQVRVRLIPWLY